MPGELVPRPPAGELDLSFRNYKIDRAAGRASLYFDVANEAAKALCGLYGKSPSSVARIIPFGSGLIDNSRGIFDDMCEGNAPTPPPPTQQYNGGQCDSVRYRVTLDVTVTTVAFSPTRLFDQIVRVVDDVNGPATSIFLSDPGTNSSNGLTWNGFQRVQIACRGQGGSGVLPPGLYSPYGGSSPTITNVQTISVQRVDAQPDLCGNPVPSYPPPKTDPTDFDKSVSITISPGVKINVPLSIVPTFSPSLNVFRPEFNVNVGGINVNVSGGGFTFSPTLEIPVNVNVPFFDPRTVTPTPRPIGPAPSTPSTPTDLTPVLDKVKEIKDELDRCCDRLSPYGEPLTSEYDIQTFPESIAARYNLPSRTFRVTIQVVARPANEKIIVGNGSDDVLFCGWAWFDRGGGLSERLPIDAANKSYEPPARSQGTFVYAMYAGYTAIVRAYYAKTTAKP